MTNRLKDSKGKQVAFAMLPHRVLESPKLDIYSKMVFWALARHGNKICPSYTRIMFLIGVKKRAIITRSLRQLEFYKLIERYQQPHSRKIYYSLYCNQTPDVPVDALIVTYGNHHGSLR